MENRYLYDTYANYYAQGMEALKENSIATAKNSFLSAAWSLLQLAKNSTGNSKTLRLEKAKELMALAESIQVSQDSNGNSNVDGTGVDVVSLDQDGNKPTLVTSLQKLNDLIGLSSAKEQVKAWVEQIKVFKLREEQGLPIPSISYHLIFTGNPGTGKTTVARIMAEIYCALGITKTSKFVEASRSDLVGRYIGETAIKTKEVLNKAMGGVLFIDEAYTLSDRGDNDFGQEAVDTILKVMEDHRDEIVVITAGYEGLMEGFINSNPGLASRFKTQIHFEDYTPDELYKIFLSFCIKDQYLLADGSDVAVKAYVKDVYKDRDDKFGNGREMRNLFERIIANQSQRIACMDNPSKRDLMSILEIDVPTFHKESKIDASSVVEAIPVTKENVVENPAPEIKKEVAPEVVPVNKPTVQDTPVTTNKKVVSPEDSLLGDNSAINIDPEFRFDWDSLPSISFEDVAGLDDVKEEVKIKVLLPLKNPEAFEGYQKKNGGGLLLFGPPGTGKTMIAAAIAREIGARFCSVKPSDLLRVGVGNTEKAVRALFAQARQFPVSVIYFDEMDAIAQKDTRSSISKSLRSELLAQLQGIDSYGKDNGHILYLIAATNKPWDMDSAFLRPGRFGTRIYVGLPDLEARKYMIQSRLNKINANGKVYLAQDINIDEIAEATNCFNGSDMSNLLDKVEELSILRGIDNGNKYICQEDFQLALDVVTSSVQKADIEKLKDWRKSNNLS